MKFIPAAHNIPRGNTAYNTADFSPRRREEIKDKEEGQQQMKKQSN